MFALVRGTTLGAVSTSSRRKILPNPAAVVGLSATIPHFHSRRQHHTSKSAPSWKNSTETRGYFTTLARLQNTTKTVERAGVAGIPQLHRPSDLERMRTEAIQECERLRSKVIQTPPSAATLELLDHMSNSMCKVLDVAEFLRNVHPDQNFLEAANNTFQKFHSYLHKLNTDVHLYKCIADVVNSPAVFDSFTPEQKRTAELMKNDMEKNGIHLPDSVRETVVELNSRIDELCAQFQHSMESRHSPPARGAKEPEDLIPFTELDGVPAQVLNRFPKNLVTDPATKQRYVRVTPSSVALNSAILNNAFRSSVRERVHKITYTTTAKPQNLAILDELIATRDALAKTLNQPSFAHLTTKQNLAKTPENVWDFLVELSERIKPKAEQELNILINDKLNLEAVSRGTTPEAINTPELAKIYEWDYHFYAKRHKAKMKYLSVDVTEYFSLDKCIEGLRTITHALFNVRLMPAPLAPGEAWRDSIRKFVLEDDQNGTLGHLYFDFFSGIPNSAHFTLRCGMQLSPTEYQLPVVCIALDLNPPANTYNSSSAPTGDVTRDSKCFLSHSQLTTLFHEFGHGLHAILGRTKYQNVSGTRTALDFVETPSEFMEYFAWDYRTLSLFAKHYSSGAVIPEGVVKSLTQSKHVFSALELQTQIMFSMLDLTYFGKQPMVAPISKKVPASTTEILQEIKNQYTSIPYLPGTYAHSELLHLSNYAAGYYSYLYARVFSAHIWHKFFAQDPLSREAGETYRRELLAYGGSKDPQKILQDFLGVSKPDPTYLLKEMGIE